MPFSPEPRLRPFDTRSIVSSPTHAENTADRGRVESEMAGNIDEPVTELNAGPPDLSVPIPLQVSRIEQLGQ